MNKRFTKLTVIITTPFTINFIDAQTITLWGSDEFVKIEKAQETDAA